MGKCIFAGVTVMCLAACSGGGAQAPTKTSSSADTVLCSSSAGPLIGPANTLGDAGDVQECRPGGQCLSVTTPGQGSGPGWTCVYASGSSNAGDQ
jgi:hypothetical protein